jgi:transcriptional regulator with XRE-family HTH domain
METQNHANFGSFFESLRQRHGLTLREFCKKAAADPANISRMERGVMPPPKRTEILERYAKALGIQAGSDDWYEFFDLAAADGGIIPQDLMKDSELVKVLPFFFRTLRGEKPTPEEMRRVAEKIRRMRS